MKFINKEVVIQSGKKKITHHNMIYNAYFNQFASLDHGNETALDVLLIKFDEPFDSEYFNPENSYNTNIFDVAITDSALFTTNYTKSQLEILYHYACGTSDTWNYNTGETDDELFCKLYAGRRITAIGFATNIFSVGNVKVGAIIDTTDYDLYVSETDFNVYRRDLISTDYELYNSTYPLHLAPKLIGKANTSRLKYVSAVSEIFTSGQGDSDYAYSDNFTINNNTISAQLDIPEFTHTDLFCNDWYTCSENLACQKGNPTIIAYAYDMIYDDGETEETVGEYKMYTSNNESGLKDLTITYGRSI